MRKKPGTILYSYAIMLLVAALFSAFYNSHHQIGWNQAGKSGLISCGIGAVLAAVLAALWDKGKTWALWGGLILSFLFLCTTGWRGFMALREYSDGNGDKWFGAAVSSLAFLVSLRAFMLLSLQARRL